MLFMILLLKSSVLSESTSHTSTLTTRKHLYKLTLFKALCFRFGVCYLLQMYCPAILTIDTHSGMQFP